MQSDSTHDPGTTPEHRSLTDLWRDLGTTGDAWRGSNYAPVEGRAYIETRDVFHERLGALADHRNLATIHEHAQVEHPDVAWAAQATTFVTGRFAEGRAR